MPVECGGCRRPGERWCERCAAAVRDVPVRLRPRLDPGIAVWSAGRYRGAAGRAVVALKEQHRRDLVAPLAATLAGTLLTLARWGELPGPDRLCLVPAPTRRAAARARGGDPVTRLARAAAERLGDRVTVWPGLYTAGWARDSAGLDARGRSANLAAAVHIRRLPQPPPGAAIILVDDVLTTGATLRAATARLDRAGFPPGLAVVLAGA